MAIEMAAGVIHLMEVRTGKVVARLEDPHGDRATWLRFTPDGTQLVAVASYSHAIHIWDLRTIRRELKTIGLDWEWPAVAAEEERSDGNESSILEVEIVDGRGLNGF
jgi:WD40 repeat protein